MIFGVLPEDLDAIQFGAVGRQIEQHHVMFEKPSVDGFLIDVVMDRCVVEYHHRRQAGRAFPRDLVKELHDIRTFDRGHAGVMCQQVSAEIQCAED